MKVFSEFFQGPIRNYYYYIKYFPCSSKSFHDFFFFQAYLSYCNLCSPPFLGAVIWPFSSCGLQGLADVPFSRTLISIFKGVERSLNVQFVFMTLLFCISDFSSHPQHILLLRAVSSTNSVLLSLGEVCSGVGMFWRRRLLSGG